jgi:gas vesicle protein
MLNSIFNHENFRYAQSHIPNLISKTFPFKHHTSPIFTARSISDKVTIAGDIPEGANDHAYLLMPLTEYLKDKQQHINIIRYPISILRNEIYQLKNIKRFDDIYLNPDLPRLIYSIGETLSFLTAGQCPTILFTTFSNNSASLLKTFTNMSDCSVLPKQITDAILGKDNNTVLIQQNKTKNLIVVLTEGDYNNGAALTKIILAVPQLFRHIFTENLYQNKDIKNFYEGIRLAMQNVSSNSVIDFFQQGIDALYKKLYDLEFIQIEKTLGTLQSQVIERTKTILMNDIASYEKQMETLIEQTGNLFEVIKAQKMQLTGLINEGKEEMDPADIKLIKKLNAIEEIKYDKNNNIIEILWRVPLDFTDVELIQRWRNTSTNSDWNNPHSLKNKVMDIFFIKKTHIMTVKLKTYYNLSSATIKIIKTDWNPSKDYNWVRHPHLNNYSCLGTNREIINQYLRDGDIVSAILQTATAAHELNITDTSPVERLFDDIRAYKNYIKVINKTTGESEVLNDVIANYNSEDE